MPGITIDATTAQLMGAACSEIAKVVGVNPLFTGLINCGVAMAVRLSDEGYAVPSLAELQRKQDELAALPELPETGPES